MRNLLLLLVLSVMFSCKKEDVFSEKIQGEWIAIEVYVNGKWHNLDGANFNIVITEDYIDQPYNTSYNVTDDKEIIFSDGSIVAVCFTGDKMRWSFIDGTHLKMIK